MTIAFKKVREAYGWMSNMSPHPIQTWRTAEALFQALRFDDITVKLAIHNEKSPMFPAASRTSPTCAWSC